VSAGRRLPVFLTRTQHRFAPWAVLVSGAAVTVVIGLLALLTDVVGHPFLMTSFAASCVLEFVLPAAPVSQPVNVIGGHLVGAVCGLLALSFLPGSWWALALATGVTVMVMTGLRILHPPAASLPLIIMQDAQDWSYLFTPILVGTVIIVVLGLLYRRLMGSRLHR
jgi:CBS-domain-containing membrane protein